MQKFEEIVAENFKNFTRHKYTDSRNLWTPSRLNTRKSTSKCIIIKILKTKGKILKADGENQHISYKGAIVQIMADLSLEIMEARRNRQSTFQMLKEKNY